MIDFIGVGAQKSGTSWVYTCLYEHPEVCIPIKEIHFFSRPRFEKGKEWYESHFKKCDESKKSGEFSTSYLYSVEAPERIYNLYPDAKLIAILRNPMDRAISQYRNAIKAGEITESVTFEAFILQEKSVIEQGRYHEQLQRYYSLFPQEQLLVLVYEDMRKNPELFMKQIYQFLGINSDFKASMLNHEVNIARTPKSVSVGRVMHHTAEFLRGIGLDTFVHAVRKAGLPDFVHKLNTKDIDVSSGVDRSLLSKYFVEDTAKLSTLLNRDLTTQWGI